LNFTIAVRLSTGWRRLIGSFKLQVIFRKRASNYSALLWKVTYEDKGSYESSPPYIQVYCSQLNALSLLLRMHSTHITHTLFRLTPHTHSLTTHTTHIHFRLVPHTHSLLTHITHTLANALTSHTHFRLTSHTHSLMHLSHITHTLIPHTLPHHTHFRLTPHTHSVIHSNHITHTLVPSTNSTHTNPTHNPTSHTHFRLTPHTHSLIHSRPITHTLLRSTHITHTRIPHSLSHQRPTLEYSQANTLHYHHTHALEF